MKVQIGIICHDPLNNEPLEKCLDALARFDAGIQFELLCQFTEGSHPQNWNRLVDRADADVICILEDDIAVMNHLWLLALSRTMWTYPRAGLVMPILTKDGKDAWQGFEGWIDKTIPVPQIFTFCNMVRLKAGLRADENLTYFVDTDLTLQAHAAGYETLCNGHVWAWHHLDDKSLSEAPDKLEIQAKDKAYLAEKWPQPKGERANGNRTAPNGKQGVPAQGANQVPIAHD